MTNLLPTPPGEASAPSIGLDAAGRPTIAWSHKTAGGSSIYLVQFDGERWSALGPSVSERGLSKTAARALAPSVQVDFMGHPIVVWQDLSYGNYEIYLKRWSGSTWEELNGSATKGGLSKTLSGLSVNPVLALRKDSTPIVAWEERFGANSEVYVRGMKGKLQGGHWEDIGGKSGFHSKTNEKVGRSAFPAIALDEKDYPVVAWQDNLKGSFQVFSQRWVGSKWEQVGGPVGGSVMRLAGDAVAPSVTLDPSGSPVIAWQQEISSGSAIYLSRWDGKQWSGIGSSNSGDGVSTGLPVASLPALAISAGKPVVAFQAGPKGHTRAYVRRWSGSAWEPWPGTAQGLVVQSTASAEAVRMAASQNGICVTWQETSAQDNRIAVACR